MRLLIFYHNHTIYLNEREFFMFLLSFAVVDIRFIIGKVLGTVLARYRFSMIFATLVANA